MEIEIKGKKALKFNPEFIQPGVPIRYRYNVNDHYFLALIKEVGPNMIIITNGFVDRTVELLEVTQEICEIIPLQMEDGGKIIVETVIFDVDQIPIGSIFLDQDDLAFMITDVQPFYFSIISSQGVHMDVQSETFFTLDKEEQRGCKVILPPLFVKEMIEAGKSYKENV